MKKNIVGIIAGISFGVASFAYADNPPPYCNACNYLNEMYTWMLNQDTPLFGASNPPQQLITTNTAPVDQLMTNGAAALYNGNATDTFTQFLYAMYQSDTSFTTQLQTASGNPFSTYVNDNSILSLTVGAGAVASDTLYIHNLDQYGAQYITGTNKQFLAKPEAGKVALHDTYFNYATLITPSVYTPEQQTAATQFIRYATEDTANLTEGVSFSQLYKQPDALLALKQNPVYQNYVMTIRNLVAIRSMTLNTLGALVTERTPSANLAGAAGQTVSGPVSPLQVEAYQANHRIEDPNWYQKIDSESPAAVEHEIAIELAEIEHQNYQAHLDRERIMSELSAIALANNASTQQTVLLQAGNNVNKAIDSAISGVKQKQNQEKQQQIQQNK